MSSKGALSILDTEVPRKLGPLLKPMRYKGAYGGRGGAKSHFFAEEVILRCYERQTRVACIREVQKSIKDSVKQLLADKIEKFGLTSFFTVLETEIRGANGSVIIFVGMQSYNAQNIKSLEGYDVAWVEEAQTLSEYSLDLLRPTLRKQGSELWFSWNPRYKTDPVDKFFRKSPPANAVSVMINWQDNPWFRETSLYEDMLADFRKDPDKAEHIWNGAYGASQGAILSKWVNRAERENRLHNEVLFDPRGAPFEISSDIGYRDTASWWFWQRRMNGFALLGYTGASGMDADEWSDTLRGQMEAWGLPIGMLGKIHLPHDARAKTFQSKHSVVERFISKFGFEHVSIVAQSKKHDQISAAREIIERCEFHKERCEAGIDGLQAWEFEWIEDNQAFSREPLHNWASHPSDAFAYGCQVMQELPPPTAKEIPGRVMQVQAGSASAVRSQMTMNDAWDTLTPTGGDRIR